MPRAAPVHVALVWHMHQPPYQNPRTGRALLPWVRAHAIKSYHHMAACVRDAPDVRVTFNVTPCLLVQLDDLAARGGSDPLSEALDATASALELSGRRLLRQAVLDVPPRSFVRSAPSFPGLAERLRRAEAEASLTALSADDVRDAQAWVRLAWLGPAAARNEPAARLLERQSPASAADLDALGALERRLVGEIGPLYRWLAENGRVELATSPWYHPILPLLLDPARAREALPDLPLDNVPRDLAPDAAAQLDRALRAHVARFGREAAGVWPPEGSVSPEVAMLLAGRGVRWCATDEAILARSLDVSATESQGGRPVAAHLGRPWRMATPAGECTVFFRDKVLSDLIGFTYGAWGAEDAVADLIERIVAAADAARPLAGEAPPVVTIALDGENAWDAYEENGEPFLRALYAALARDPRLVTTTPSAYLAQWPGACETLPRLASGSWVDGTFRIWIGHPDDRAAWALIGETRAALARWCAGPGSAPEAAAARAAAWDALHGAEASDWFWWYGDEHWTAELGQFDQLFREHLLRVFELIGEAAPARLFESVPAGAPAGGGARGVTTPPTALVTPTLDGRLGSYYEWAGAGSVDVRGGGGAMHQRGRLLRGLFYGSGLEDVFLRLDPSRNPADGECVVAIEVLAPRRIRVRGRLAAGVREAEDAEQATPRGWEPVAPPPGWVAETVLEIALSHEMLGARPGETVRLVVSVSGPDGSVETWPAVGALGVLVPSEAAAREDWSA